MSICLYRDLNHHFITIFLGTICLKVCALEIQFFMLLNKKNNLFYCGKIIYCTVVIVLFCA